MTQPMPDFRAATNFIWTTARLIDRLRFVHLFLGGPREPVLMALRPYQNPDGGFGNGLEPDIRASASQPIPVWTALVLLDELGAFDDPMVGRALDYLTTITTAEGGVPFALPSIRDYPRAPWWETKDDPPANVNPTACIAALLYKNKVSHPWLDKATEFSWRKIEAMDIGDPYEVRAVLPFLDHAPERDRAEKALAHIGKMLFDRKLVALDPGAAGEVHFPLMYAPRPDGMARKLFAYDVIERHLDAFAEAQQEDGGWPINWLVWAPAVGLEWRAFVTVEALLTLRAYGRLPEMGAK